MKPVGGESGAAGDVTVTVASEGPAEELADGDTKGAFDGAAEAVPADGIETTLAEAVPAQPVSASARTRVIGASVARIREVGLWKVTS